MMKKLFLLLPLALVLPAVADDDNFRSFDKNGDKVVEYIEYARAKKLKFDRLDRDRNKSVSLPELERAMAAEQAEASESKKAGTPVEITYDVFALPHFDELDKDKNESVSLMEFGGGVKQVFDALDGIETGKLDKKITLAEYAKAVDKAKAEAQASAAAKATKKGSQAKGSGAKPKP